MRSSCRWPSRSWILAAAVAPGLAATAALLVPARAEACLSSLCDIWDAFRRFHLEYDVVAPDGAWYSGSTVARVMN